jgi:hypothetical protein
MLPQVLIVTGDSKDRALYEAANRDRFTLTFLISDQEIQNFVSIIAHGEFLAIIVGLSSAQRTRVSPPSIVGYAKCFNPDLIIIGVCHLKEWRQMITNTGATHAVATPAEAIDFVSTRLNSAG